MHQDALGGSWSLSSSQNDQLPATVGTPLNKPLFESEIPGGSNPLRMRNWYGRAGPQPAPP